MGDDKEKSKGDTSERNRPYQQTDDVIDEVLEDEEAHSDVDLADSTLKPQTPYRAYVRTSPQYIPHRGVSRYKNALQNLIPVRRKVGPKEKIAVDNAGFISFVSFSWISHYMYKAYRKGLTADDIPEGSPYDSCDLNAQRLEMLWQEEVSRKGPKAASFGSVVWKFVRTRVLASSFIFSLSIIMGFISPTIFMRKLLEYSEGDGVDVMDGVTWALCLSLTEFLRTIFFAWNWAVNYRTAIRLRSACLAMLYRKVIRLNSLGDKSTGELINIFANDGQRMYDMILFGPMIIGGPVVTVGGVIYILWLLGPWALLGMLTFLLFYPTQYGISRLTGYLRAKAVVVSDQRVKLMTEILNCMKLIKMYAWERYFSKDLFIIRKKERSLLQKTAYCQSMSVSMAPTIPVISAIVTFLAHVSAGNNLTTAQAFPVITYYVKQAGLALYLLQECCLRLYDGIISIHRIQGILLLEDITPYIIRPIDKSQALCMYNATFAWDTIPINSSDEKKTSKKFASRIRTLSRQTNTRELEKEKLNTEEGQDCKRINILFDIIFIVPKGRLVGVCGHVGSGKTSLLLAALGQMRIISGQVMRDGSCAYVAQEAWIQNATLRENVLFGENFNSRRYYDTLYNCCLNDDINMLPGGDQTEIGERGINLSGGQKQRVSLARALYSNRDIYFLDDPLSAVDAHVGAHIFEKYVLGALANKTVIFVTHQVQYLNHCDEVYMMKDGRIIEHGTHVELMAQAKEYSLMVKTCYNETKKGNRHSGDKTNTDSPNGSCTSVDLSRSISRSRTISCGSQVSLEEVVEQIDPRVGEQLMSVEKVEKGTISFHTYQSYIAAAGGYCVAFIVCICFLLNVGSTAFSSWWLATWIKSGGGNATKVVNNVTVASHNINDNPDFHMYQTVYAVTIGVILGTSLLRGLVYTKATLRASNNLHNKLFDMITHSPMSFFETTPLGRIQNVFSRDMEEVDVRLPITVEGILQNIWTVTFAVLFICLVFPWFFVPLAILAFVYYFVSKIFRVAVRDLTRLETVSRSPIFSCIGTTVNGLSTIHAFGKEGEFNSKFTKLFDENSTCQYLRCIAMRWLAFRIDTLAVSSTCITAFLVIILHGQVPPALAGLALAYSAQISGVFQYTIRLISETEVRFISVERMNSYIDTLVKEDRKSSKSTPPSGWPSKGGIRFQNASLIYRKGLPRVLKDVNINIDGGEKIGIVGRTGSGKSSLIVALFRLVELSSGKIKIDGQDIADINLEKLRSCLSAIPQDPVLFAGTVRSNLDPGGACSDSQIWDALEKTRLREKVSSMAEQLEAKLSPGGDSLSVGERQLLCLARALLRETHILVLDEATAAVDPETEALVQNTIQCEFKNCTVLTIAHRLTTVTRCDRILVMEGGQVVEYDTPTNLLANPSSQFSKMLSVAEAAVKAVMEPPSS